MPDLVSVKDEDALASREAVRRAIEMWADNNTGAETYHRRDKVGDKIAVVESFLAFAAKHPAEVMPSDVQAWRAAMEAKGHAPATVYARVSRVSSFYRWLMRDPRLSRLIDSNPAAQARPPYSPPYQTKAASALTDDEMNRLITEVKRRADKGAVVAKRDYALLLFYFVTGLRRSEVISLRGGDLSIENGTLVVKYRRKGGKYTGREVGEPAVREALVEYLRASGRSDVLLGTGAPLWTRHDRAGRPGAPLASRSFVENLKLYARAARIKHIHLHQTRHTYARIVAEETGSLHDTQEALDHENPATTRVYVQRITVKRDKHAKRISSRIAALK